MMCVVRLENMIDGLPKTLIAGDGHSHSLIRRVKPRFT